MDFTILLDMGLGGMALALYLKISPLLDKTKELVGLLQTQMADHELRITKLEQK
jgi:hypothetical protein